MAEIDFTNIASGSIATPAAGVVALFSNSATKRLNFKDDTGLTGQIGSQNGWLDATTYGILTTNTGAQNSTALTNLVGAAGSAPAGSTIYFPGGTYQFASAVTVSAAYSFVGQGDNLTGGFTILQFVTGTTGFLTLASGHWYTSFTNITFSTGTTQVSGAMVTCGNNDNINFYDCTFAPQGGTMYNCIDYTNGGVISLVFGCQFTGFTNCGIVVNASNTSLVLEVCTMNGVWGTTVQCAASGINI